MRATNCRAFFVPSRSRIIKPFGTGIYHGIRILQKALQILSHPSLNITELLAHGYTLLIRSLVTVFVFAEGFHSHVATIC